MNRETVCNTLRSRFKTLVADVESLTTFYDNEQVDPANLTSTFAIMSVVFGESTQVSAGEDQTAQFRGVGMATVELNGPLGAGDGALLALADKVEIALRRVSISHLTIRTPSTERVGPQGGRYVLVVTAPFYFDHFA